MQLEAHPDRSWLGAYLDELQVGRGGAYKYFILASGFPFQVVSWGANS